MPRALRSNTKAPADRVSLPRAAKKNSVDTSKLEKKIKNLQAKLKTSVEKVKQLEIVAYDTCLERERLNESTQMMEQERQKYTEAYKELENEKKKLGETNTEKAEPFCCKICLRAYTTAAALSPRLLNCGHTLCLFCASEIACGPEAVVRCPFCRQETPVPDGVHTLKKNFSIFESLPPSESEDFIVLLGDDNFQIVAPASMPGAVPMPLLQNLLSRLRSL